MAGPRGADDLAGFGPVRIIDLDQATLWNAIALCAEQDALGRIFVQMGIDLIQIGLRQCQLHAGAAGRLRHLYGAYLQLDEAILPAVPECRCVF